jgi:polysaccharide export outer membrane protein
MRGTYRQCVCGTAAGLALCLLVGHAPAFAQDAPQAAPPSAGSVKESADTDDKAVRRSYVLGADDQISIWVLESDEFNGKVYRVGRDVNLPLVGRVPAAGLTIEAFEDLLRVRLSKYIRQPEVVVNMVDFRSQPVSVIGAVTTPGIFQLRGRKTLIEVLSMAGGLRSDAGSAVKITRRKEEGNIPLATATEDGNFQVAEVPLKNIMDAGNPERNIEIRTNDVLSVPAAKMVYVIGNVEKAGGFALHEKDTISVLEAISMAGGISRASSPSNAKILRPLLGGPKRAELPVDVHRILEGKASDVPLLPDDILFIPASVAKSSMAAALGALIQSGTYLGISRGIR